MKKIDVFICTSHHDIEAAKVIRETLSDCYGFDVFLYDHSLVGEDDFVKKIISRLESCEIFIVLISENLKKSYFCNQEIGYALNKSKAGKTKIIPLTLDNTHPYGLIDHAHVVQCKQNEQYGVLKTTSYIYALLVSHSVFKKFKQRALNCMLSVIQKCTDWKPASTISYTLEFYNDINLNKAQVNKLVKALNKNTFIKTNLSESYGKMSEYLRVKHSITLV